MIAATDRRKIKTRIHKRIRKRVSGTAERPRLTVNFSGKHVYAQVIDDDAGKTLVAAATTEKDFRGKGKSAANRATAEQIGKTIAERLKAKKVDTVVFDRGGFLYHGKVKALADAAREGGLKF
jgi:large subunit ribosomal protein L18